MEGHTLITAADDVCASTQITFNPIAPNGRNDESALWNKETASSRRIDAVDIANNVLTSDGTGLMRVETIPTMPIAISLSLSLSCVFVTPSTATAGMESPSGPRLGKLSSSGLPKGRTPKHGHPQEPVRTTPVPENNNRHSEWRAAALCSMKTLCDFRSVQCYFTDCFWMWELGELFLCDPGLLLDWFQDECLNVLMQHKVLLLSAYRMTYQHILYVCDICNSTFAHASLNSFDFPEAGVFVSLGLLFRISVPFLKDLFTKHKTVYPAFLNVLLRINEARCNSTPLATEGPGNYRLFPRTALQWENPTNKYCQALTWVKPQAIWMGMEDFGKGEPGEGIMFQSNNEQMIMTLLIESGRLGKLGPTLIWPSCFGCYKIDSKPQTHRAPMQD